MCTVAEPAASGFSTVSSDHLFLFLRRDLRPLRRTAAGDRYIVEVDVDRVQRDLRGWLQHPDRDGFIALELGLIEIWSEGELVILRTCTFR